MAVNANIMLTLLISFIEDYGRTYHSDYIQIWCIEMIAEKKNI